MVADWEEAYTNLRAVLGLPTDESIPSYPHAQRAPVGASAASGSAAKRKARDEDEDGSEAAAEPVPSSDAQKRTKTNGSNAANADEATPHARAAAYIPFLTSEELAPPKLPTREDMEGVLLSLRKRALLEEYFGEDGQPAAVA